jgi:hypothetical protein
VAADTRPGAKIRLKLRLEDFGIDPPPPEFFTNQSGIEAFGSGGNDPVQPGDYLKTIDIEPYDFSIELNSPRKADTAKCTFPRSKLPIDPQILRSCGLQIFMGVFTSREYAEACGPTGAPGLAIPDIVPDGRPFAGESNERFRGFVDEYGVTLRAGGNIVELTARDTTGFFMDAEIHENPLRGLPIDMPLDQIIRGMLAGDGLPPATTRRGGLPGARGTAVVVETSRAVPTLAQIKGPNWYGAKRTVKKARRKQAEKAKKMTFWDFATDLAVSAGLKVYMRPGKTPTYIPGLGYVLPAAELVLCDAQTYYAGKPNKSSPLFAYGRNVEEMTIRRQLGGTPMKTIEIRSFDRRTGKQIRGRYPPEAKKRTNKASPSGKGDREEIAVYEISEISGPKAQEQVEAAARSFYDQLARGEFTVNIRTKALAAIPGNEEKEDAPDLLYLKPGDPIYAVTDPARDEYGQVTYEGQLKSMSQAEFQKVLEANNYPPTAAKAIAKAQYDSRVQQTFFTQTIAYGYTVANGIDISIQAINYLDARGAIDNPKGNDQ